MNTRTLNRYVSWFERQADSFLDGGFLPLIAISSLVCFFYTIARN
jgi:hypothetical protein